MKKIHHLGVVCKDINDALKAFNLSLNDITEIYHDEEQNNKIYFFYLKDNNLWLEFVVPLNKESTVWGFANRNNFGLHHLGFNSLDLQNEKLNFNQLTGVFELKNYFLKINSFGGRINTLFFSFRGLLIEFVKKLN